jgi:queuine tRNA-ribosyltransferase
MFSTIMVLFFQIDNCLFKIRLRKLTFVTTTEREMFTIESRDGATSARAGILRTAHGDIPTPIFMPVGTAATVKGFSTGISGMKLTHR